MIFGKGYGRPGDDLTWKWLNNLLKICRTNRLMLGDSSGISLNRIDGIGTWIAVDVQPTNVFVGIVQSPGITARSGLTMGSGPVEIYYKDAATGAYVDSGQEVTVDSISSTTGGVPDGTWVTCSYQPDGTPTLLNVDCGN